MEGLAPHAFAPTKQDAGVLGGRTQSHAGYCCPSLRWTSCRGRRLVAGRTRVSGVLGRNSHARAGGCGCRGSKQRLETRRGSSTQAVVCPTRTPAAASLRELCRAAGRTGIC
eukprot:scaffold451_cov365-Prasinococcus_capsulatus_cf.AAC.39